MKEILPQLASRDVEERPVARIIDADAQEGRVTLREGRHSGEHKRAGEESAAGTANGGLSSFFKYYGTEQNKRKFELILKCAGLRALGWEGD